MMQDIITVLMALCIFDMIKILSAGIVCAYRSYKVEKLKRNKCFNLDKDIK